MERAKAWMDWFSPVHRALLISPEIHPRAFADYPDKTLSTVVTPLMRLALAWAISLLQ
jgi:hypothetical protein